MHLTSGSELNWRLSLLLIIKEAAAASDEHLPVPRFAILPIAILP